ncbi:MAG: response regulator [Ardenticatenaceae bacterium]|nr:response regulator [Anaerolineales bacterium]MCB8979102.1 response regulator [Ardenticatenaceae bacterium]
MEEQHTNQPPQDKLEKRPSAAQKSVLIIDDERQVRETIEDILDMESVNTLAAANGEEGVTQFAANQEQIGLIILDLSMPGMSGIDTFTALREIDPTVKIILSSGYSEGDILKKLGRMHPTGFLNKPYRLETVLQIIKQHLA